MGFKWEAGVSTVDAKDSIHRVQGKKFLWIGAGGPSSLVNPNKGVRAGAIPVAIGGLLTVASLLTGCSGATPDKPFIHDIRANASFFSTYSDESLVEFAHHLCKMRRDGTSYGEIRKGLIKPDDTPQFEVQVAFVLARSIGHYCPEQAP